jgi:hypothetical protein
VPAFDITERIPFAFSTGTSRQATDSAGLSDSISVALIESRSPTDTAGLTDSTAKQVGKSASESAGMTDSVTATKILSRALTESAGISDGLSISLNHGRNALDSVGPTDSVSLAASYGRDPSDAVGLTDSLTEELIITPPLAANSAGLTDSLDVERGTTAGSDSTGIRDDMAVELTAIVFTPPVVRERYPFRHLTTYTIPRSTTILKEGGFYRQVSDPDIEELEAADEAYLGGRGYRVAPSEADDLTAAGYGAYLSVQHF